MNGRDKQKEGIAEVRDGSDIDEYKGMWGKGTITCGRMDLKNSSILSSGFLRLE